MDATEKPPNERWELDSGVGAGGRERQKVKGNSGGGLLVSE